MTNCIKLRHNSHLNPYSNVNWLEKIIFYNLISCMVLFANNTFQTVFAILERLHRSHKLASTAP